MKRVAFGYVRVFALTGAGRCGRRGDRRRHGRQTPAQPDYVFCTVCHGAHGNGNPAINAPKIAGIEPWYLKQQLTNFRAGVRGTEAHRRARHGDAACRRASSMMPPSKRLPPTSRSSMRSRHPSRCKATRSEGRALYATCSGCHGTSAEGNSALKAPALAGQTDWYLVRQLERFRNGERGFAAEDTPGVTMRAAAAALPDAAAVNDLVAYINTLSAKHRGT